MPTALALGSFDGLHAGHRRVIEAVCHDPAGGVPTVVSFWPHPREVLHGEPRLRLDLPDEKLHLLEPLGIQQLVLVRFDRNWLSSVQPNSFSRCWSAHCRPATSPSAPTSGSARAWWSRHPEGSGGAAGVRVSILPILEDPGGRMSSSRIREALADGDLSTARDLLQRPYRFQGVVVQGRGLGRQLGWPTANLQVDGRKFLPGLGVYAARAWVDDDGPLPAVMNLGPQPTVDPGSPSAVEVHLLDTHRELVGRHLKVEPVERLRGQQRFSGLEALSAQISRDAQRARERLQVTDG